MTAQDHAQAAEMYTERAAQWASRSDTMDTPALVSALQGVTEAILCLAQVTADAANPTNLWGERI